MDELRSRLAALLARLDASRFGARLQRARQRAARGNRPARRVWRQGRRGVRVVTRPLAAVLRRAGAVVRPGTPPVWYRDRRVTLDRDGVIIGGYYVPFGRRRIPYERIRQVETYPLTGGRQYRIHGFGWPRQWYHRDRDRAQRDVGLLLETGGMLRPVVTPEDPATVRELLVERIPQAASGPAQH